MDLEASIRAFALADTDIAAAISTRWFVDFIPDDAVYPLVKMSQVANAPRYSHSGNSGRVVTFQADIYADDKAGANSTAESVLERFDAYKGVVGSVTAGYIWARDVRGEWSPETRKFRRIVEIEIGTND